MNKYLVTGIILLILTIALAVWGVKSFGEARSTVEHYSQVLNLQFWTKNGKDMIVLDWGRCKQIMIEDGYRRATEKEILAFWEQFGENLIETDY